MVAATLERRDVMIKVHQVITVANQMGGTGKRPPQSIRLRSWAAGSSNLADRLRLE